MVRGRSGQRARPPDEGEPVFGPAYYLEFAPGIAEDESILDETGLEVDTLFDHYDNVIRIIDSSALSDGVEFKYYAPDVGEITEAEIAPDGSTTIKTDLYRTGTVGAGDTDDVGRRGRGAVEAPRGRELGTWATRATSIRPRWPGRAPRS